jgi:hypothetical protein
MEKIYQSAAKVVFIMLAVTACAGFLLGLLPTDQFMILSMSAFSFYFAKKDLSSTEVK